MSPPTGLLSMKKSTDTPSGIEPATCSAVPQPTAAPRPLVLYLIFINVTRVLSISVGCTVEFLFTVCNLQVRVGTVQASEHRFSVFITFSVSLRSLRAAVPCLLCVWPKISTGYVTRDPTMEKTTVRDSYYKWTNTNAFNWTLHNIVIYEGNIKFLMLLVKSNSFGTILKTENM
jgi:hypothetical protein